MQKNLAFPSHVLRGLFLEQETGRLFIVYQVKIKFHSIIIEWRSGNRLFTLVIVK